MRTLLLTAILGVALAGTAQAERRMFVIANDADGYGIDRCLAAGDKCGAAAANAYCKTRAFTEAATFHKVDRDEITGGIPSDDSGGCSGGKCDNMVGIVCAR